LCLHAGPAPNTSNSFVEIPNWNHISGSIHSVPLSSGQFQLASVTLNLFLHVLQLFGPVVVSFEDTVLILVMLFFQTLLDDLSFMNSDDGDDNDDNDDNDDDDDDAFLMT
ncbi:hypothetical protein STEG23_017737, partial [Scotinomys teguina]